jgi:putative hydrolase of the HAD superfamily
MQPLLPASPIQGVIFDFGSTLAINCVPWSEIHRDGAAALAAWLGASGLRLPADFAAQWLDTLRASIHQAEADGIERPADDVLTGLLAQLGQDHLSPAFVQAASDRFFAVEDAARRPATGAVALLAELKRAGYRLGLLSNTIIGRWVQRWVDQYGFRAYLDAVVTSDEIGFRKPRPEIFTSTLARMGLSDPRRVVMVGDTPRHDIAGAGAAGLRSVLVRLDEDRSLGLRPPPAPDEPAADACISSLAALSPLLAKWQSHAG